MSTPMPWGPVPGAPTGNDPAESLRRIEQHTAELVQWMKYLVIAVGVLVVLTALLFA
jgi:hypothetical protein